MNEEGFHGSTSFSDFRSDPRLLALKHSLRFSPLNRWEVEAGYGQHLPQSYTRQTNDGPTAALDTEQKYYLNHLQDYFLNVRHRRENGEAYFSFKEKRQKAKSDAVLLLNSTVSFDDINAHFEDMALGWRVLTREDEARTQKKYLDIVYPQLSGGQTHFDFRTGFKKGKMKNSSDIYVSGGLFVINYTHELRTHFLPGVLAKYGLSDKLEIGSGITYTTPFKYVYEFERLDSDGDTNLIRASYSTDIQLAVPVNVLYRPADNMAVKISTDFQFTDQRLDYHQRQVDTGVVTTTNFNARKLKAYNVKPTIELSYLFGEDSEGEAEPFQQLAKPLLKHRQTLIKARFLRDITHLNKAAANGTHNVIDPNNVFLYPLDLFVSGSEYGSFFLGNKTTRAAESPQQNYYELDLGFLYGIRDNLNAGLSVGYHSESTLHHFTLHDLANRFYRFEPYNYFDFLVDWKVKDNNMLTLQVHYVPQYQTNLESSAQDEAFEVETRYYAASITWKVLF